MKDDFCFCMPQHGFTCKACERKAQADEPLEGLIREELADLTGYGYFQADQDGFDGGYVKPEEHKEEEFFSAATELLSAS